MLRWCVGGGLCFSTVLGEGFLEECCNCLDYESVEGDIRMGGGVWIFLEGFILDI